jgi:hypothetical protein
VSEADLDRAFSSANDPFTKQFMQALTEQSERNVQASEGGRGLIPAERPDAAAAAVETGLDRAKATGKVNVPSELYTAWQDLRPRWAEQAAATGDNMAEDLPFFARRVIQGAENPRKLMGAERKALKSAQSAGKELFPGAPREDFGTSTGQPVPRPDTRMAFPDDGTPLPDDNDLLRQFLSDESGSISPELAQKLGLHATSAAAGAGLGYLGSDDEHKTRNAIGMGLVGAAAPLALQKGGLDQLSKLRYFSMLASPSAQLKNVVGNSGSVLVRAGEEALTGNTQGAKDLLSSVFSRETAARIAEAYKHAGADIPGDTRWGQTSGPLGIPSRMMHGVDEGVTQGLERGGLSTDEAKLSLFTSEPRSKVGKWIASRPPAASIAMPFVRTATNMVERGLEHTPGVGLLPAVREMRGDDSRRVMARQAMGALAMLAGGYGLSEVPRALQPYVAAAAGPLALPLMAGSQISKAYESHAPHADPFAKAVKSQGTLLADQLPLPSGSYEYDPSRILASFVPGVLAAANGADSPSDFEQPGLFDPSIAKIPFLNSALLRRKPKRARRVSR